MNFSFYSDYPIWYFLLCILAGVGYAFALYRKEKRFSETRKIVRIILPALRFVVVTLLALFLLSPMLKHVSRIVEKPIIIFAQDNSQSVLAAKDSGFYKTIYKKSLSAMLSNLSSHYDTHVFSFGDRLTPIPPLLPIVIGMERESGGEVFDFSEKQTDISSLFDEIETRFSNRNIGAVIVASDGLYNKGQNPVYKTSQIKFPVYTVALGDTTIKKDIAITKILHNRIAYLGNKFPVEIQISARELDGNVATCTVSKGEQILFSQKIFISGNIFFISVPVQLEAKEVGLQQYTIKLSKTADETNYLNNVKDIFMEVLDSKQNILLLANAPHPDIAAIKNSLESNGNYEVNSFLAEDFISPVAGYNLLILHQLPSAKNKIEKLLAVVEQEKIPVLFILGSQTSVSLFNAAQPYLTLLSSSGKINDAAAIFSEDFSSFTVSDALKNFLSKLSPLASPFGNYKVNLPASVLFEQKIGTVETQQPLWFFTQSGERKVGFICGEGIWRWRLADFAEHGNCNIFNELINKSVQYLSAKTNKSLFRIFSKNLFYENEPIEFDAELYNDSYELITSPDVQLTITNSEGKNFPFTFSKTINAYHLDAGIFPPGVYRYEAKTKTGNKILSASGKFYVAALQIETINTVADHGLLYRMAKQSGGEVVFPNQLEHLADILQKREDLKPLSRSEKKLSDLINLKYLFFLFCILLSLEWLTRKINGAY